MRTKECSIYEDLMPLEMDGLLQAESSEQLYEHLNSCTHCQDLYQNLRNPISVPPQAESQSIDYLKTIRAKQRKKMFFTVSGIILALIIGGLLKLFVIGSETEDYKRIFAASLAGTRDNPIDQHKLKAELFSSAEVFSRYKIIDEGDNYVVKVYTVLASPLHSDTKLEIVIPNDKPAIIAGDIWYPNELVATKYARQLYEARTEYIGDNSKVSNLLSLVGMDQFGPFEISLKTDKKPFRLTITFSEEQVYGTETLSSLHIRGRILFSLIGNMDQLSIFYPVDGNKELIDIRRSDLDRVYKDRGFSMEYFSQSPAQLQLLLSELKFQR